MHRLLPTQRIGRAGLGLAAAALLALAGCSSGGGTTGTGTDGTGTDGTGTQDSPQLALASSADRLGDTSFKIEMQMGEMMTATGQMDPAAGAGSMTMNVGAEGITMAIETIFTESDMWMNMGEMGALLGGEGWLHLDMSKLGEEGLMGVKPGQADPANAAALLQGLGEVERVDERTFRGTIDLTRAPDSSFADDQVLAELGDGAQTLPFTATVDDEGRLSEFAIDMPAMATVPAQQMVVRYYDYGTPVEINPPPADEVSEAPDLFYGTMGS